ncbi:MAG: hypothetical protein ACI4TX_00185 [Christensenellales bacterium]
MEKPEDMKLSEARKKAQILAYEFESKMKKEVNGLSYNLSEITFSEFSKEWLKHIKSVDSDNYYIMVKRYITLLNNYFGEIKLKDINALMIQKFIDSLYEHKVVQESAKLKKSMKYLLIEKNIHAKKIYNYTGVNYCVYSSAHRGENISLKNAKKLCSGLDINFDDYFESIIVTKPYAKESILKYTRTLSSFL